MITSAHPMHPVGSLMLAFSPSNQRESWDVYGLKGFYLGPSLKHYRCHRIYVINTSSERVIDTIAVYHFSTGASKHIRQDHLTAPVARSEGAT